MSRSAERVAALAVALVLVVPAGEAVIHGHTDSVGDAQSNLTLSRRRAEAVRAELVRLLGATSVSFEVRGFGEARPVAPNRVDGRDNPEGRARNRRVEIRFDR